ncbi:MAG: DinB family protein [Blastocatellia bacterium]|nr:DinB family protein [Blastocatellia bacterium]
MSELKRITKQLQGTFEGDAWYGPSLLSTLDGITAAKAAAKPIADGHSIWEIVLHVAAWMGAVRKRLESGEVGLPDEGDWPEVGEPTEAAWADVRELLRERHRALLAEVAKLTDDEQLRTRLGDVRERETGGGVSIYVTLHGVIQHNIYHAGQISLLKRL